jgi:hypothetical protein
MVRFVGVWVSALVTFFVLCLEQAVFSSIINQTLSDLVDIYAWHNAPLMSAKILVVGFYNLFPYILSFTILFWATISPLRREESDVYV